MADFYSTRSLSIQLLLRRYSPHARLFYNPVSPQVTFEFFRARGWLSAGSLGHKRAKERSNWKLEPRFIGIRLYISDVSPFTQTFLPAKPTPSSPNLLPFFFVRFYLTKNFTLLSFFFFVPYLASKIPPFSLFRKLENDPSRWMPVLMPVLCRIGMAKRRGGEGTRLEAGAILCSSPLVESFGDEPTPPVFESRRDASSVECPTSRLTIVFAAGCAAESAWLRPTAARFNAEEGAGWKETRSRSISRITFVPGGGSSTPLCGCSADSHSVEENFDPFSVRAGFSNEVKLITLEIKIDSFRNVM